MPCQYDKVYAPIEKNYKEKEDKKDDYGGGDKKDACGGDSKSCCIFPKHPEPKKILLECGCRPQDAIFETYGYGYEKHEEAFVLDSVLVDTTCLCRPLVKIEFSSLVVFEAKTKDCYEKEIEVELLFELVRSCKGEKEVLQTWKYEKEFEFCGVEKFELEISEPFTVTFCDRACPDCCEYKIIVKAKEVKGEFKALRVVKPDLSALAQGICD
ncbi:hypothetical protein SDC9_49215 [bioreactor metagenome]|uniref:Uncharacterized protein n=1 Tax=bioreactor metagenome TaxID=1076179 RepID=A0A644WGG6_9ZZZZ